MSFRFAVHNHRLILDDGGAPGGGSFEPIEHVQSAPAALWTINHNLGRLVGVEVMNAAGDTVAADIARLTANQVRILFATPQIGRALII